MGDKKETTYDVEGVVVQLDHSGESKTLHGSMTAQEFADEIGGTIDEQGRVMPPGQRQGGVESYITVDSVDTPDTVEKPMHKVYYADTDDKMRPVETQCEELGHPNLDVDGRTMYVNTHYESKQEAWGRVLADAHAGFALAVKECQQLEKALQKAKDSVYEFSQKYLQAVEAKRLEDETKQEEVAAKDKKIS